MKPSKSRKALRHDRILAALEENPSLRVNQLAEELKVSTETIRRDFDELDRIGRLSRTYGGAMIAPSRFEPLLHDRLLLKVNERQAIARATVEVIGDEEVLLLGGGATMLHFAKALRDTSRRTTIITPAYPVALELSANPRIETVLPPGTFEPQELIVVGPETIRVIERYRVPVAILGASGINHEGVSEAMLGPGDVYSAMLQAAERIFILADHSKFDKRALVLLTPWQRGMTLVTDSMPAQPLATAIQDAGAEIILA